MHGRAHVPLPVHNLRGGGGRDCYQSMSRLSIVSEFHYHRRKTGRYLENFRTGWQIESHRKRPGYIYGNN